MSDQGQILYYHLLSVVDDYGRFEADLELIRARCFPRLLDRWPLSRVSEALSECGEARSSDGEPLVTIYGDDISDKKYIQINNFGQRIRTDKHGIPSPSKFPQPPTAANRREPPRKAAVDEDEGVLTKAKTKTNSVGVCQNGHGASLPSMGFPEFYRRWVAGTGRAVKETQGAQHWTAYVLLEDEPAAMECLASYVDSAEVARGIIRDLPKFIQEESENHWRSRWPPKDPPPKPAEPAFTVYDMYPDLPRPAK